MRTEDLVLVSAISDAVHGVWTEPLAIYAERLDLYPDGCRIFEQDGAVTGYLITHPWHRDQPPRLGALLCTIPPQANTYYLHDIALLPSARGTGAGKAALAFVMDRAHALGFTDITLMAIGGADRFWAAQGFTHVPHAVDPSYGAGARPMRMPVAI